MCFSKAGVIAADVQGETLFEVEGFVIAEMVLTVEGLLASLWGTIEADNRTFFALEASRNFLIPASDSSSLELSALFSRFLRLGRVRGGLCW